MSLRSGPTQRHHRAPQLQHLALHDVDLLGVHGRARLEHLGLDLVHVLLDGVGDRDVLVHDVVGDRVQHGGGPERELLRVGLQLLAHAVQAAVLAVAHRHDEVRADERHHLAGLDQLDGGGGLVVLDVGHRLEHHEQRVLVALQLGPLLRGDGVLHGQLVQAVASRRWP